VFQPPLSSNRICESRPQIRLQGRRFQRADREDQTRIQERKSQRDGWWQGRGESCGIRRILKPGCIKWRLGYSSALYAGRGGGLGGFGWGEVGGAFEERYRFEDDAVEEVQLGAYEGCGVSVTGPASYVDAVEGFVEEGAELGEGWEDEGVV
jgi:hypothetical protein